MSAPIPEGAVVLYRAVPGDRYRDIWRTDTMFGGHEYIAMPRAAFDAMVEESHQHRRDKAAFFDELGAVLEALGEDCDGAPYAQDAARKVRAERDAAESRASKAGELLRQAASALGAASFASRVGSCDANGVVDQVLDAIRAFLASGDGGAR